MCSETEGNDAVLIGLVKSGELLGEVGFRDVGAGRMKDIDNELAAGEKTVGDELPRTESNGG